MTPRSVLAALLILIAPAAAGADDAYPIKFDRPLKRGQKLHVRFTGFESAQGVVNADGRRRPLPQQTKSYALEAVVEVLELNTADGIQKARVTVEKLTQQNIGVDTALLPKGAVITAEYKDGDEHYNLEEGELSDDARHVLDRAFSLDDGKAPTDDQVLGADEPKRIGDSWEPNFKVAAKALRRDGITVKAKDITGKVTLTGKKEYQGVECLEFKPTMTLKNVKPKPDDLPPGLEVEDAVFTFDGTMLLPLDSSRIDGSESMSLTAKMKLGTPAQPGRPVIKVDMTVTATFTRHTKVMH